MALVLRVATAADMPDVVRVDDDATALYRTAGIVIDLPRDHPFTVDEQRRWAEAAAAGQMFVALDEGQIVGFASLDVLDGAAYLDQLSVHRVSMRRGIGRFLLRRAYTWARYMGSSVLFLTTYGHVPWNRPFYEREGFSVVAEPECGPAVRHHLEEQRRALPCPEHRVAMQRPV